MHESFMMFLWGLTTTQNSIRTASDLDRSRLTDTRSSENDRIRADTDPEYRIDTSLILMPLKHLISTVVFYSTLLLKLIYFTNCNFIITNVTTNTIIYNLNNFFVHHKCLSVHLAVHFIFYYILFKYVLVSYLN